jgi:hypothetical protein
MKRDDVCLSNKQGCQSNERTIQNAIVNYVSMSLCLLTNLIASSKILRDSDNEKEANKSDESVDTDNLTVKRGAATEADGEIEEVDNGDDEDSSDLIIVLQTEHGRTYCCLYCCGESVASP